MKKREKRFFATKAIATVQKASYAVKVYKNVGFKTVEEDPIK